MMVASQVWAGGGGLPVRGVWPAGAQLVQGGRVLPGEHDPGGPGKGAGGGGGGKGRARGTAGAAGALAVPAFATATSCCCPVVLHPGDPDPVRSRRPRPRAHQSIIAKASRSRRREEAALAAHDGRPCREQPHRRVRRLAPLARRCSGIHGQRRGAGVRRRAHVLRARLSRGQRPGLVARGARRVAREVAPSLDARSQRSPCIVAIPRSGQVRGRGQAGGRAGASGGGHARHARVGRGVRRVAVRAARSAPRLRPANPAQTPTP